MNRRCQQRMRGAALVEFAIIVPLLVILVLGITELGHALYQHNTLQKAVTSGARYLGRSFQGLDTTDCSSETGWSTEVDRAKNLILFGHVAGADIIAGDGSPFTHDNILPNATPDMISVTLPAASDPCIIRVVADIDYTPIFALFGGDNGLLNLPAFSLQATVEERFIGE
ncbi:MAG: pilus assembly protein [Candidatus Sedimenticola sp. (ex Thyasira tokunagai)]